MDKLHKDFSTLLIGVDILSGGDISSESGGDHFIADTWTSGLSLPEIFHDTNSKQIIKDGGANPTNRNLVEKLLSTYDLENLTIKLKKDISKIDDKSRRVYLANQVGALDVILKTRISLTQGLELPSYEERYFAGSKQEVKLIDPTEDKQKLRDALENVGYKQYPYESLQELFSRWETNIGLLKGEKIKEQVNKLTDQLLSKVATEIYSLIRDKSKVNLDLINMEGMKFKILNSVDFTGSSSFLGGVNTNGEPKLEALIEYNGDHPISSVGMIHLMSHEIIPGHYFASCLGDLLWREGTLGLETTMATMCTPSVTFCEGWAESALALLYGSEDKALETIKVVNNDLRVQLAKANLENIGKNNASVLYQYHGKSIEDVRSHLRDDCALPEPIVKKLSGGWATDPIIGPMYGPAYWFGKKIVSEAIEKYGREKVLTVGLGFKGPVDIETFQILLDQ